MLSLQKVVELCRDTALIESFVMASEARPIPTIMGSTCDGKFGA